MKQGEPLTSTCLALGGDSGEAFPTPRASEPTGPTVRAQGKEEQQRTPQD